MPVHNRIAGYAEEMKQWRHWLHRNPELAFDLPKTSTFVADRLREFGVDEIHEGIAQTGIVALIHGSATGRTVGLRADMDALPMEEQTGVKYASETPGAMHACGHDGHTTMLLGAAKYLAETRRFAGTVALVFQPAEENGGGGGVMCKEGIMDRFDISEIYGLHNAPMLPLGTISTAPGPLLAAVDDFTITITGRGGHAAHPHESADPISAAVQLASAFNTILARNINPIDTAVVSITQLHAGSAQNVIPGTATLGGTIRSFRPEVQALCRRRIGEICEGTAKSMGVEIAIVDEPGYPPTVNHERETDIATEVARQVVGEDMVTLATPEMGAEDFSFMLQERPGAYLYVGQGDGPFCHHPEYDFNDEISPIGASFFARLIETTLPLDQS